jgi:hypothetical protein
MNISVTFWAPKARYFENSNELPVPLHSAEFLKPLHDY